MGKRTVTVGGTKKVAPEEENRMRNALPNAPMNCFKRGVGSTGTILTTGSKRSGKSKLNK
jgi:hypothetical protein